MASSHLRRRIGAVCVIGVALTAPVGAAPTDKPVAKPPVWTPDRSVHDRLAAPVRFGAYQIQPPKDYVAQSQPGPEGSTATAWVGAQRTDGTRPYVTVMLLAPPPGEAGAYTPDQVLIKLTDAIARRRTNWKQTPTESGTVNGHVFVRTRWEGTDPATNRRMHGFNYVARSGTTFVQISSQDVEPYDRAALPLAEASALTFRKP